MKDDSFRTIIASVGLAEMGIALIVLPDPTQVTTVVGSIALVVNAAIVKQQHPPNDQMKG